MNPLRYIQFYVDDWIESSEVGRIHLLTAQQELLYFRLLIGAWKLHARLPADEKSLRQICQWERIRFGSAARFRPNFYKLVELQCFVLEDSKEPFYYNPRQLADYEALKRKLKPGQKKHASDDRVMTARLPDVDRIIVNSNKINGSDVFTPGKIENNKLHTPLPPLKGGHSLVAGRMKRKRHDPDLYVGSSYVSNEQCATNNYDDWLLESANGEKSHE